MGKLIGISTGLKNVDMAPGNIPCVVINSDFVKACNKYGNTAVIFGPQENLEMKMIISMQLMLNYGEWEIVK